MCVHYGFVHGNLKSPLAIIYIYIYKRNNLLVEVCARIRSDAAIEEVKRKEKALQEEKLLQEKAKAEAEVCSLDISVH